MIRVRFLTPKRYPHPDGRKRQRGEVVAVDEDTASRWEHVGIVEYVDAKPVEAAPVLEDMTVAELRTLAMQLALDVSKLKKKGDIVAAVKAEILVREVPPVTPEVPPADPEAPVTDPEQEE